MSRNEKCSLELRFSRCILFLKACHKFSDSRFRRRVAHMTSDVLPETDTYQSIMRKTLPAVVHEDSLLEDPSPIHRHLNKLIDESADDLSRLVLVSDNARVPPKAVQSTQPTRMRPISRNSFADLRTLNRPCRWTSDTSPQLTKVISNPFDSESPNSVMGGGLPLESQNSDYTTESWASSIPALPSRDTRNDKYPRGDVGLRLPERRGSCG